VKFAYKRRKNLQRQFNQRKGEDKCRRRIASTGSILVKEEVTVEREDRNPVQETNKLEMQGTK
jgi:hypothetical protein